MAALWILSVVSRGKILVVAAEIAKVAAVLQLESCNKVSNNDAINQNRLEILQEL